MVGRRSGSCVRVSKSQAERATKIDAMMEQASRALVGRDYFAAEKLALSALRRAHHDADYERMSRIILPLQEARRQKRDMAFETRKVFVVDGEIPHGRGLVAGQKAFQARVPQFLRYGGLRGGAGKRHRWCGCGR